MSLEITYVKLVLAQSFKNWLIKYSSWTSPTGATYYFRICGMTLIWRPNHVKSKPRPKPRPAKTVHEEIHIPVKEYYELKSMFDNSYKHWSE